MPTYQKTKKHNTNYYRRNKVEKFNIHKCPHCNYSTTGPKSSLQAHIWSKHTPENRRPFQCPCNDCERGFASRANLHKHLQSKHNVIIPKKKKTILLYEISLQNKNLEGLNNDRKEYYKKNNFIICNKLPIIYNNQRIDYDILEFDYLKNHINVNKLDRNNLLDKLNN